MKYKIKASYINLDSSIERNEYLIRNINDVGMSPIFTRFPAVIGAHYWNANNKLSKSELGCLLSHQHLLKEQNDDEFSLVIEDDVFLPTDFLANLNKVITMAHRHQPAMDVIFIGQTIDYRNIHKVKDLIRIHSEIDKNNKSGTYKFVLLEGKSWYKWGMFAYLVMPGAGKRISSLIESNTYLEQPIDNLISLLIKDGKIHAKVVFPYLAGLSEAKTTMVDRKLNNSEIHTGLVNMFVHNGNPDKLIANAYRNLQSPEFNLNAFIYSQLIYQIITK